jgi:hypothetical protein
VKKINRETYQIPDEQWALFLSMLKICRSIKFAAERCEIAPSTAYYKGYKDVAFFQEVTKIMNGDYEAQTLPVIITIAKEL